MENDDMGCAIANLQARMENVENENQRIRDQLKTLAETVSESAVESEKMSGEIRWIRETLENMVKRKMRGVDILMAIGMLIVGGVTAFTSIQMVQLTQAMVSISQMIK